MISKEERQLFPIPWSPWEYQKKALKLAVASILKMGGYALFLDPGMGKTSITLAIIKFLLAKGFINRVLIIAPLRVIYAVWPLEAGGWKDFCGLSIGILHDKGKEKVANEAHDIYLINPEGLTWYFTHGHKKVKPDALVVDEATMFKETTTQRFKLLKPHLSKFKMRLILTGTPISMGYLGLFGQMYIVDLGRSLGAYITHYRRKYFVEKTLPGQTYSKWVIGEGKAEEIQEMISPMALRLDAKDYLDLPQMVVNDVNIILPPAAREIYTEMEHNLMALLVNDRFATAPNTGAAVAKCRQIASGGIYVDELEVEGYHQRKKENIEIHAEKTKALLSLIEECNGSPVLVAYWYKSERERITKALGYDVPYIGSGVSKKQFLEIESAWNAGEIPVLLGQPRSMAHGLNLQSSGNHIVWYSIIPEHDLYTQFNLRLIRQGSKNKWVFVHRLVAQKTVDIVNLSMVSKKTATAADFFEALQRYLQL